MTIYRGQPATYGIIEPTTLQNLVMFCVGIVDAYGITTIGQLNLDNLDNLDNLGTAATQLRQLRHLRHLTPSAAQLRQLRHGGDATWAFSQEIVIVPFFLCVFL